MLFGTLITMFGFVPIGFAKSGVGEYAGNIFWVLAFSLLISWLVAVTFTPYLGVQLLAKPRHDAEKKDHHGVYDSPFYSRFRTVVDVCVRRRGAVVLATVTLFVLAVAGMAGAVEKQFFPGSDRDGEAYRAPVERYGWRQKLCELYRWRLAAFLHIGESRASRFVFRQSRRDCRRSS